MPRHPFDPPRGTLSRIRIESEALRGNLLGDPCRRVVEIYLPPGYGAEAGEYPLLVCLAGFTGSGLGQVSWRAFGESVPQRADRLVGEGRMGPVILAFPDGFTSFGGNQYVDSAATGRWEAFLLEEMLPAIERRYRVRPGRAGRAVFGKSSGGYGALVQGMRHADRWGAVACHSADLNFDLVYRPEFPRVLEHLARLGGDAGTFVDRMRAAVKIGRDEMHVLMLLAMAATYDPDPGAPYGIRLPVDPQTCEIIEERWSAWLRHDPLRMIDDPACQSNLRGLRGLFIDCGFRDQYGLHFGARALVRRLEALGIPHRYEEFDDDHSGTDYRMDRSLPFLYAALDGG